ncbi:carbohydrate-binding protein [Marivirga sp. S37H4]|uniref:Carbohydrate-binding protein n=1 Tax=Marivirga aurantiaca TaxID=2802615 RepID=A0A935C6F5_9BACT|nr:carbohydrate-binding protein [Marivirga aurantiaca]MBK6264340.1 carbohydrate-binding protein [Marivirga aurantiaca]
MKILNCLIRSFSFGLVLLLLLFAQKSHSQGFLRANGTQITNEDGNEIIFRGIGLGGWMLQEGYMLGTSGPQHELEARIVELIGSEKKAAFYDAWLANHVRKIDIDSMASWGYNLVRLPMHYKLFTPPIEEEAVEGEITWIDKGFEMTDALLEWCKANNMYLILDLHAAPGGQGENADISDYDPSKPSLWESEANREKTVALWRKLAERYKDEPMLAGYDIINEPNWGFQNHESDPNGCAESENALLWELQQDITEAIREVDENHIVIIEGNCWGNNYSGLPTLWDDNIVISYHKYWNANTTEAIQGMLDMREERNVPIWLGETGENSNTWFTNAISLFEENKMGWAWWPLKKLGSNNPLQIKRNTGYEDILNYWNNDGEKPSESEAYEALMQMTEDLKLENNIYHKGVVDAKIRQPHTDETIPYNSNLITPQGENIIFAVNYDLGKEGFAYHDNVSSNTTGNAGGATWNSGYSYRNDGVDIEATEDEPGNGYNVGWIEDGEWLLYTINVEEEGNYQLNIRTASTNTSGKMKVLIDDVAATEVIALPNTSDYQTFETTTVKDVYLKEGTQKLKLYFETGGFNLNYFQLEGPEASVEQPKAIEKKATHKKKEVKLIFNQAFNEVPEDAGFSVSINGADATINSVVHDSENQRVITLQLEEQLLYHDTVLVSYSGSSVTTQSGVVMEDFTNESVTIELENGVIPHVVPGRIQAEDFVLNNGFELEETEDSGGGMNVGYTDNGDYLDYMIDVEESGSYSVKYRVASQDNGGALALKLIPDEGAEETLSEVEFSATGGWQTWASAEGSNATLEKGLHKIRLLAKASLFNINWFSLSKIPDGEVPTANRELLKDELVTIFPNPSQSSFTIKFTGSERPEFIFIHSVDGETLMKLMPEDGAEELVVNHQLDSGLYLLTVITSQYRAVQKVLIK